MDFVATLWNAGAFLLGYLVPFLFVLTVVVFVHELGHFLVGRWCGVDVKVFSIGFGRELFGFNDRHGTRWRFALIPLGGYVKFSGDTEASSSGTDDAALATMTARQRERSFPAQSVGERAAIVAAGPIANFLLAILIFASTAYIFGKPVLAPRVDQVVAGSAAERGGLLAGDLVLSIDGRPIAGFADMQRAISARPNETLSIVVDRAGSTLTLPVTPALVEQSSPLGKQRIGVLGVQASRQASDWKTQHFGLLESAKLGVSETWYVVERTYDYLAKLVTGRESVDQLSGPIRIAQVSGLVADSAGLLGLINLAAILSVSIGLMNLFPVPMLDGGHLLFYAVEALRGRPLSERAQEIGFRLGLGLVLMLMLFVTWNDIVHVRSLL
ncbi:RIP metalloprotease RseP [Bosea sp. Root381]|uniref:RIP metalloprotease RseP n=1 Tax=Bosea sp. Root381 TaxID=1736524 RepID=UPI0007008FD0|nr:RIP metalloprotease RseP [Bosea sp. Root381]KRE16570.1 RIP metalloprotease RseP [Bosea sp. Root381]